jgi:hypothetical protein
MRLLTAYKLALALAPLSIIHKTAAWECSATSNVTMINLKDAPDHRHMQIIARGFKSPYATVWPRRTSTRVPNGIVRTVKYCYANTAVYSAVNYQMQSAMATWSIAVGTDNQLYGHSLTWKMAQRSSNKPIDCYGPTYHSFDNPGPWNPNLEADYLAIHLEYNTGSAAAKVGCTPDAWVLPGHGKEGRLNLLVYPFSNPGLAVIANLVHELGHGVGLAHEFNRPDRDHYMEFRCYLLKRYFQAVQDAMTEGVPQLDA